MRSHAVARANEEPVSKVLARDWHRNKWKYMIMIPVIIYLILFCYKPMYGLVVAFKNFKISKGISGSAWADPWYKWFVSFFTDPYFPRVIKNTFILSGLTILFSFPAPIILALLINEVNNKLFKRSVQTITYMPYFISLVVLCGMINVYCKQDGLFSQIAVAFGGTQQNYLASPKYFRTIYVLSDIWQKIGWDSIIYLAAISAIDQEQYEAAKVDGANRFQQMIKITLPGMMPTIMILLILRLGGILNVGYEKVLLLYNASTYEVADVISSYTYRLSFPTSGTPMYSKSTAIGLFNTIVNVVFLVVTNAISKRTTESSVF